MVIGGIAILAFTSIKLTLFIVGVIPPLIIVTFIFGRFIRKYAKKVQDEIAESNTIVEETFAGIQTVKAFANEAWERSRYRERIQKVVGLAITGGITAVPFQALSPSVCSEPSPWSFGSGLGWCTRENWPQINSMNSFYTPSLLADL
jgi:ABC-type multidrug transport system fused ATPase/permease subunit